MTIPLLKTKLYIPPPRPELVSRPRLIERLNAALVLGDKYRGLDRKLTLISAPAGFGKTTLVSEWVQALGGTDPPIAIAWLSLDEGDRAALADLFDPDLTERDLLAVNHRDDLYIRDIAQEARAVSAHARLAAALEKRAGAA